MLSPVIEEISETEPGIKVCSVNVDEQMELAAQFQISSIPTLLAFKGGQLVNQSLGVIPKAQILGLVK